jgi:hypothetical protein
LGLLELPYWVCHGFQTNSPCQNLDKRKLSFLVSVGKPPATFANLFL